MESMSNGWYVDSNDEYCLCNAHISYKGYSIIIDYEWCLHAYDPDDKIRKTTEGLVPFEVYPYKDSVYVGYVHTDSNYRKADISELISALNSII